MKGIKKWVRDKTCLPVWSMLPKLSTSCSSSDVALEKACWETSMTAAASIASLVSPLLLILLLISTSCSLVVFVRARGKGSKRWSLEVFVRARDQGSRSKRWSMFISPMARSRSESNNSWEKNIFFWSLSLEWGMPKHNCFRCLFTHPHSLESLSHSPTLLSLCARNSVGALFVDLAENRSLGWKSTNSHVSHALRFFRSALLFAKSARQSKNAKRTTERKSHGLACKKTKKCFILGINFFTLKRKIN